MLNNYINKQQWILTVLGISIQGKETRRMCEARRTLRIFASYLIEFICIQLYLLKFIWIYSNLFGLSWNYFELFKLFIIENIKGVYKCISKLKFVHLKMMFFPLVR